jgi:hypothetical protein
LTDFFANTLPKDILSVKHALDIVQSLLDKSDITYEEPVPEESTTFFEDSTSNLDGDDLLSPDPRNNDRDEDDDYINHGNPFSHRQRSSRQKPEDEIKSLDPLADAVRISHLVD